MSETICPGCGADRHIPEPHTICGYCTVELSKKCDPVTKPVHYNFAGIECIDAIKAALGPEGFRDYMMGNVMKYCWRYKYKNGVEDLEKARWYLDRTIEELKSGEE
jgi:hypothetical protein